MVAFAKHFGGMTVLHSPPADGMLRAAAVDEGIVAVTMEAGGPNRLEEEAVDYGVQALETLLENLDMRKASRFWGAAAGVLRVGMDSRRPGRDSALRGGTQRAGQQGADSRHRHRPDQQHRQRHHRPYDGRVLGMAVNQVVHAGFAAYRIGEEKSAEEVEAKAEQAQEQGDSDGDGENTGAGASTEESDRPDGDTE